MIGIATGPASGTLVIDVDGKLGQESLRSMLSAIGGEERADFRHAPGRVLIITGDRLLNAIRTQSFIGNGQEFYVEGAKYDFRMGSRLLEFGQGNLDTDKLTEKGMLCGARIARVTFSSGQNGAVSWKRRSILCSATSRGDANNAERA